MGVHVEKGAVTEVIKETPLLETHQALVDGCFEVNAPSLCCQLQILHGINPDEDMRVFVMDRSAERSRCKRFFEQPWDNILHASRTESGSGAERLANEARDGVDLTGHEALVLVRSPDAKGSGSAIVGRRTAIAAVLLQVRMFGRTVDRGFQCAWCHSGNSIEWYYYSSTRGPIAIALSS